MAKLIKNGVLYDIFRTRWGFFGFCFTEGGLLKTALPASKQAVKANLLSKFPEACPNATVFRDLRDRIKVYYEGERVNFGSFSRINISFFTDFSRQVLTACQKIPYGKTVSYRQLAKQIKHPSAARAVGTVLAKNPIPLIIPCHRVIRTDGKLGGFSAPGGINTKQKMLNLEALNIQ